jgi:hypothetical protein
MILKKRGWRATFAAAVATLVLFLLPVAAQEEAQPVVEPPTVFGSPLPEDGPSYRISEFVLRYLRENPSHPPIDEIMLVPVQLGRTAQGYVAPREDVAPVTMTIAQASEHGLQTYYASAVQSIIVAVRDYLVDRNLLGVYVAPDPLQINESGQDLRQQRGDSNPLTLILATGSVTQVRTLGSGERVKAGGWTWGGSIEPEDRIDHPAHARIRERSPILPYQPEQEQANLLKKDVLDEYLFHLSRHPGRRVDASVAAGDEPGAVILDYQVTENRPLTLYAQISNTGTKATDYWRQRFGILHTQVTNNDDIFSFDFITSWFDETNAVLASYDAPFENDRIRWRIYGNWTEFTADDVGFFGQDFTGESWAIGGELSWNFFQRREMFVDAFGGLRFENIHVNNAAFFIEGDEDFVIPYFGLRYDRRTDWYATQASVQLEWWLSNASQADLAALGRTAPDTDPTIFKGGLTHSVYLEPLFNRKNWEDLSTPEDSTLAHEFVASVRGQYSFGNRLIPQAEQVVGGLYTVRGYPESIVAGDDAVIGSLEYRLHLPRLFGLQPDPGTLFGKPFRTAPQYVFGPVDWDLVPKAFFDVGRVYISDPFGFESDQTLMGAGIGIDLLYRRNLNVRLDWGFVLEEINALNVNEGSNRLHFVATILF